MSNFRFIACFSVIYFLLSSQISIASDSLYFPPNESIWDTVDISTIGWDLDSLNKSLFYAKEQKSSGIIILFKGKILVERYWDVKATGFFKLYNKVVYGKTKDGRVIQDVGSVQKSIVSVLCGIAQGKGILDFDTAVGYYLGKHWSKAPIQQEKLINIRHLLSMTSGLDTDLDFDIQAGQKWKFNTPAYGILVKVLVTATGKDINQLTKEWITGPIGMTESIWAQRDSKGFFSFYSKEANTIGFMTTARDLARFGLLMLAKGIWEGRNIVDNPAYYQQALVPQPLKPTYGLFWWLNTDKLLIKDAPDDTFLAWGTRSCHVYVVPCLNLVVVRVGDEPKDGRDGFIKKFLPLVLQAKRNIQK